MDAAKWLANRADRLFDRVRHRAAFGVGESGAIDGDLRPLRGHKYALLVTFRRDGTPVPSPVWCAVDDDGRAYIKTAANVGKVKRVQHDSRVVIAPCTARGVPTGPAVRATARVLSSAERSHAEGVLAAAYGVGRRASEALLGVAAPSEYLELTPRSG